MISKNDPFIIIKGAGEMATGVAWTLFFAGFRKIAMTEVPYPRAVRRAVSFAEAIYAGSHTVEGIKAVRIQHFREIQKCWKKKIIPVIVDPECAVLSRLKADILVDATLLKKNFNTKKTDAPLVIGLGPGFTPGKNCRIAIETNRGHNLGKILKRGRPEPNTGLPHPICGFSSERVFRAPQNGIFFATKKIGGYIRKGEILGSVGNKKIKAKISGVIRGILRSETYVKQGEKLGDIDPRNIKKYCFTISDKARTIGGAVLLAIPGKIKR